MNPIDLSLDPSTSIVVRLLYGNPDGNLDLNKHSGNGFKSPVRFHNGGYGEFIENLNQEGKLRVPDRMFKPPGIWAAIREPSRPAIRDHLFGYFSVVLHLNHQGLKRGPVLSAKLPYKGHQNERASDYRTNDPKKCR
jgi:hypothetical protein